MDLTIKNYIRPGLRAHLVGIGGVSMAPLAEVLLGKGETNAENKSYGKS